MDTNTDPIRPNASAASRAVAVPAADAAVAVFAVGPTITVLAMALLARGEVWLSPALLVPATLGMLIGLWGPHPASLPSLWSQTARDRVASTEHWLVRAVVMLPALLGEQATRSVTLAQMAGWAAAGVALLLAS